MNKPEKKNLISRKNECNLLNSDINNCTAGFEDFDLGIYCQQHSALQDFTDTHNQRNLNTQFNIPINLSKMSGNVLEKINETFGTHKNTQRQLTAANSECHLNE